MWVAFANAKATHIFQQKILAYMPYLMIKVLTICQLTTSLVLNNWAQGYNRKHIEEQTLDLSFTEAFHVTAM